MFHETSQSDAALFKRMFPKPETTNHSRALLKRLKKLGIDCQKSPSQWTEDERSAVCRLDIDPQTITWQRVLDTCDRHLRGVQVGIGPKETVKNKDTSEGAPARLQHDRRTGFDITVASEVMAVLALSTSLADLREKLGNMVVGYTKQGATVTTDDLGVGGALAVLMKDAIMPTVMQTVERTPVLVRQTNELIR